jgi:hypothetical protein
MHAGWTIDHETRASLNLSLIPLWAIDAIVAVARTHYAADRSDVRTNVAWNQAVAKWVRRDWNDPKRRPSKPAPSDADARSKREIELQRAFDEQVEFESQQASEELRRRGIKISGAVDPTKIVEGIG